jgi:hypothetical protein
MPMGAWGHRAFENDDAADWGASLEHRDGRQRISAAFAAVLKADEDDDYLDAPAASQAIAAAEVVAALAGKPSASLPSDVSEWIAANKLPNRGLIEVAKRVVSRVLDNSELKELWAEGGADYAKSWQTELQDLLDRLNESDLTNG